MSNLLAPKVIAAFAEINLSRRLQETSAQSVKIKTAMRELDEVEQNIPTLDRVLFFHDTPSEKRAKELKTIIQTERHTLRGLRAALDADLKGLSATFPPVELWRRIDGAMKLSQTDLQIGGLFKKAKKPKALLADLHTLADRILAIYIPDFDPHALVEALRDEDRCRAIAGNPGDIAVPHPELGYEPVRSEALIAAVAGKMLEQGFFHAEKRLARLEQKRLEARENWDTVKTQVGLIDELNVFSVSETEKNRVEAVKRARQAREQWIAADEDNHLLLLSFLEIYPPLALHHEVGAVIGALHSLGPVAVRAIAPHGDIIDRTVVEPRAIVHEALLGLRRAYLSTFPGIPMPSTVEDNTLRDDTAQSALTQSPRHQILREFTRSLDRRDGKDLLTQALRHASMHHTWAHARDKLDDRVGFMDKVVFWSDTGDQSMADLARSRKQWHKKALFETWRKLVSQARDASREQPALLVREWAIATGLHIKAITTASSPCRVSHHRNDALNHLKQIESILQSAYGLHGSRQTMMADVANALVKPDDPSLKAETFRVRPYNDIIMLVARPLRGTSYRDDFIRLSEATSKWHELNQRKSEAESVISFWDYANIFTDTKAEKARDSLKATMGPLNQQIQTDSHRVNHYFDHALQAYPPAQIYALIGGVSLAVGAVYAKLVRRTTTDSKGRTRTTYSCDLFGKAAAVRANQRWNAALLSSFGPLPDIHECLERWVSF